MKLKLWIYITFGMIICLGVGFMASLAIQTSINTWYQALEKPFFTPPSWIFAPVWTTLYIMMTLAIWFFWHSKKRDVNTIYIYFIHIVFNATWSIVFFGLHQIFFALVVLVILILLIIILIIRFKRVNFVSYYLMIPYLLWCFYALFLNYNLMVLN